MKYIVLTRNIGNGLIQEVPVLFPDDIVHSDMAKMLLSSTYKFTGVVSAGTCQTHAVKVEPDSHSESLKLKSRSEDQNLIRTMDYLHGIKDAPAPVLVESDQNWAESLFGE